jgi:hypothetical protein
MVSVDRSEVQTISGSCLFLFLFRFHIELFENGGRPGAFKPWISLNPLLSGSFVSIHLAG